MSQHVYIHVPFCTGKCSYCAFYSTLYSSKAAETYLKSLDREISLSPSLAPVTLYIGGGTPSALSLALWGKLAAIIERRFDITSLVEWTVESNPDAIHRHLLRLWRRIGVTRVSMGAQTDDNSTLKTLGRRHTAAAMSRAMSLLKDEGFDNVNLDLLAGIPGSTPDTFSRSLETMLSLEPSHLSVYAFTVEPHTRWESGVRNGTLAPPDEAAQLRDLRMAASTLRKHGFRRYEVSNYARRGRECRYNIAVWAGNDYLGFGPAAATRLGTRRWTNAPDLSSYVQATRLGIPPPRDSETLDPNRDVAERLAFAFRMTNGILLDDFVARWGRPAADELPRWMLTLQALAAEGLVRQRANRWIPTARGLTFNDRIAESLLP
jgi:oxygen-independent coproporphyrinogen-3 oxidase